MQVARWQRQMKGSQCTLFIAVMVCVGAIALHSLISSHAVANQAHEPAISKAPEAYSRPKGANMQDGGCGVYEFDCSIGMDDEGI
ncbi:unnamed protein product [Phytophthora fragariaefolia]|uniref:Unnamed protein product n=1 Tax=Phytophthora fragariaefolia TaxID=1490495 RepID=A0A9W6YCF5_9STRA|nr:unnamed protein product [Phytophthora fragariaefolia]